MKRKSTNNEKAIVLALAITSLLLAGTILTPTQATALSKFNTNTDTSNLKHDIRDGVSVKLEHRDQDMDQENLCYRTNTCRQSNTGQNTLGNDNSITGFADQSDNLKQSAAAPITPSTAPITPSTANQTTANNTSPTPTPTPTTATLTVIKIVSGPRPTTVTPANFTIHVTANNPNPPNFAGSATGTDVTLGPGTFNVTETGLAGFTTSFSSDCSGTIAAGQHLTCTITNTAPTPIPGACPAGTAFDLSLTGALVIPGVVTLPTGTVLCVSPTGIVLAEILSSGTVLSVTVVLDGQPAGPAPGVCTAGNVVAVVASGTVPTTLPPTIVIGPLGVCVHLLVNR